MRKFLILAVLAAVVSVSALAGASLFPGTSAAQPGTLYAVDGAGGGGGCSTTPKDSNLYTMNPSTGAATLVAPIMINSTPAKHVTGIAVHPSSGVLYGVMNDQEAGCAGATLLTINTSTGAATVIGSLGSLSSGPAFPDIDFDPFGQLYGWTDSPDVLVTIDIANGTTATVVGGCGCNTFRTGLAIKATGDMYLKSGDDGAGPLLHRINVASGAILTTTILDKDPHNLLAFDPSDVLFTGTRNQSAGTFTLQTINHTTGAVSDVGTTSVSGGISAIAFDRTGLTSPLEDLQDAVAGLAPDAFKSGGLQTATLSRLDDIEQEIVDGDEDGAIRHLENLRRRMDGCGAVAEKNDWIVDCAAQLEIRALIDLVIADLAA